MKKVSTIFLGLILGCFLPNATSFAQTKNIDTNSVWTWMNGINGTGRYQIDYEKMGIKGTPYDMVTPPVSTSQMNNWPGSKARMAYWTDTLGNFYIFSGCFNGQNSFNEVWKIDPSDTTWTWVSGASGFVSSGSKGTSNPTPNSPSSSYLPETREYATFAVDSAGCLWVFGGFDNKTISTIRNDLWRYNPYENKWTYYGGSTARQSHEAGVYGTKGVAASSNWPGARQDGAAWIKNDKFYMFSGTGYDATHTSSKDRLGALWVFDMNTLEWTWIGGQDAQVSTLVTHYGTKGVPDTANYPQPRKGAQTWTDEDGNFWMYGGYSNVGVGGYYLNDLWKYTPSTDMWTWMGGGKIPNDYNVTTATNRYATHGDFGQKGVQSASNWPPSREWAGTWVDDQGNFWLFGGYGLVSTPNATTPQNDIWKYDPESKLWTWMGGAKVGVTTKQGPPGQYNQSPGAHPGGRGRAAIWQDNNGNVWTFGGTGGGTSCCSATRSDLWMLSGVTPANSLSITDVDPLSQNSPSFCAGDTVTVSYGATGTFNSGNTFSVILSDSNGSFISSIPDTIGQLTGTADTGEITVIIPNNIPQSSEYRMKMVSSNPGVKSDDIGVSFSINPSPTITINASTDSVCQGEQVTLTASGADQYSWNHGISNGTPFSPDATTTYTVTGISANGCSASAETTVYVTEMNLSVTINGLELEAAPGADSYQWINCKDNSPINGATDRSFSPNTAGNYAVVITNGSCRDTSECKLVTGIKDIQKLKGITLYPNPAQNKVIIKADQAFKNASMSVVNIVGKTMMTKENISGNTFKLDIRNLAAGVYYLELHEGNKTGRFMFVKK